VTVQKLVRRVEREKGATERHLGTTLSVWGLGAGLGALVAALGVVALLR
jgi:hypothetical protein